MLRRLIRGQQIKAMFVYTLSAHIIDYAVYDKAHARVLTSPHDLGLCFFNASADNRNYSILFSALRSCIKKIFFHVAVFFVKKGKRRFIINGFFLVAPTQPDIKCWNGPLSSFFTVYISTYVDVIKQTTF
jgi:hypothetical protein